MNIISFVVGRFQPFHNGHLALVKKAIEHSDNGPTIVFIGSSNAEESARNPFNFYKRVDMISKSFSREELKNIILMPLPDFEYDIEWIQHVAHCLRTIAEKNQYDEVTYRAVVCDKDADTTNSNDLFELLDNCEVIRIVNSNIMSATDIRDQIFNHNVKPDDIHELPFSTKSVLNEILHHQGLIHSEV